MPHLTSLYYAFSASLFALLVIERVAYACCYLSIRLIFGDYGKQSRSHHLLSSMLECVGDHFHIRKYSYDQQAYFILAHNSVANSSNNNLKGYASMQLVGALFTFASAIGSAVASSFTATISALSGYILWAVGASLIFAMLYVVQENHTEVLVDAVKQWNSGYGPLVHKLVFVPLQVIDVMFSSIVPLYNGFVWLIRQLIQDVLLDSLVQNVPSIKAFGTAAGSLSKHMAMELPPYISSMASSCQYSVQGDRCYDPGNNRTLDLVTSMAHVRNMSVAVAKIAISMCASASAPVNIGFFPLMDINFAKGVHNIANAFLYAVFQLPSVTAQRCINHGRLNQSSSLSSVDILMCLPDLNPPINMLVAGIRNMGVMVDNWLDVFSIIAQVSLSIGGKGLDCQATAKSLTPAYYSKQLFDGASASDDEPTRLGIANRPKIVVGLTSGLYAVTDGVHAQYFNHYDSVDSQTSPYAWPIEVDTRFGIAAVTFREGTGAEERDAAGDTTTTMMGCRYDIPMYVYVCMYSKHKKINTHTKNPQVHGQQRATAHTHPVRFRVPGISLHPTAEQRNRQRGQQLFLLIILVGNDIRHIAGCV